MSKEILITKGDSLYLFKDKKERKKKLSLTLHSAKTCGLSSPFIKGNT
jgi:hypothetical protein